MSDTSKLSTCQMVCWGLAGLTGVMVALGSTRSLSVISSLIIGIVVAVVLGIVVRRLVCTDYPADDRGIGSGDIMRGVRNVTGITGYKAPLDQAGAMDVAMGRASNSAKAEPKASSSAKAEPKAADAEKPAKAAKAAAATGSAVKSGTTLAGETELSERKGTWRYGSGDDTGTDPGQTSAAVDASIGVKPAGLSAPRGGQADDLKQIKGLGPKLEQALHDLGYYHFDQIAAWTPDEIAWVDENLVGFKGRVSRDNWVDQAKTLAAGGDTEFSKRVAKDDAH